MTRIHSLLGRAMVAAAALFVALPASSGEREGEGVWRKIGNLGSVLGADGNMHTARCSGFPGSDPDFNFWAKKGSSKNLMVYFEGGGACWDNFTCSFPFAPGAPASLPQFFAPAIDPTTDPNAFDGIFRKSNQSPVADWSVVYIPYCTADLHAGSATKTYFNAGNPFLPVPSFQIHHRGFDNFMVVLDWMKKNIDEPKNMLVTGVSAGGYGAAINFPWLARTYPNAKLNVLADASQSVTAPLFDVAPVGRNSWNPQFAPWVWPANASGIPSSELLRVATHAFPEAKVAQFTTALDGVQIAFYGVMKQLYGYGGNCPNPDANSTAIDWYQQMSGKIVSYGQTLPNYRYYVAGGGYHTILGRPEFYTEASAGVSFSEFVDDMISNRGGRHGHGGGDWRNSACPTCLIQLPCP